VAAADRPDLLARWLMPNDFRPVVGHAFTFVTDPRLSISWRGGPLDTTVTWTLVPEGRGTRLVLVHDGFDPDDPAQQRTAAILGQGWRSNVLAGLERVLTALL
jgi:uncharacterized protein YndB with AHSA1/START domain